MMNPLPTPNIPNFRQIRSFLALAKHLSFTRAAEELGISQPTLTVQIHQLEDILSVMLFDRNRRQVHLTDAGKNLLQPLEQLLTDIEAIMNLSGDLAQLRTGSLRIAALPSIASGLVSKAVRAFTQSHPGINVQIEDVDVEIVTEMVKSEQVDFGIGIRLLPDRDIIMDDFLVEQFSVYYPEGHPLQARRPQKLRLKDCLKYPVVLTNRNGSIRKLLERALLDEQLDISVADEVNQVVTAVGMVRDGLGIAILPTSMTLVTMMDGIGFTRIDCPSLHQEIGILRKASKRLSPVSEAFLKMLRDAASRDKFFKDNVVVAGRSNIFQS